MMDDRRYNLPLLLIYQHRHPFSLDKDGFVLVRRGDEDTSDKKRQFTSTDKNKWRCRQIGERGRLLHPSVGTMVVTGEGKENSKGEIVSF